MKIIKTANKNLENEDGKDKLYGYFKRQTKENYTGDDLVWLRGKPEERKWISFKRRFKNCVKATVYNTQENSKST